MAVLDTITTLLNRVLIALAGVFLVAMIGLTCANIVCRFLWVPLRGTFELMGFFGAVITAFALAGAWVNGSHIAVDVLIHRYPKKLQSAAAVISNGLSMVFFGVAAWQITRWATTIRQTGEVTETLRIIYYPFIYAVAVGCAVLALVLLTATIKVLCAPDRGEM